MKKKIKKKIINFNIYFIKIIKIFSTHAGTRNIRVARIIYIINLIINILPRTKLSLINKKRVYITPSIYKSNLKYRKLTKTKKNGCIKRDGIGQVLFQ